MILTFRKNKKGTKQTLFTISFQFYNIVTGISMDKLEPIKITPFNKNLSKLQKPSKIFLHYTYISL